MVVFELNVVGDEVLGPRGKRTLVHLAVVLREHADVQRSRRVAQLQYFARRVAAGDPTELGGLKSKEVILCRR